jgi:hypothetical protein
LYKNTNILANSRKVCLISFQQNEKSPILRGFPLFRFAIFAVLGVAKFAAHAPFLQLPLGGAG